MPCTTARTSWKAFALSPRSAIQCGRAAETMTPPKPQEPEILAFVAAVDRFYAADSVTATIAEQRQRYDALCRAFSAPLPAGLSAADESAPHPEGAIPLRRYRPADCGDGTLVVYFHGGGFIVGGLASHQAICAEI